MVQKTPGWARQEHALSGLGAACRIGCGDGHVQPLESAPSRHEKVRRLRGLGSRSARGQAPGDEYIFLINGELERKDPRARMVTSSEGKGVISNTSGFDWGRDWRRPEVALGDLVIYQLHPGTFHDPDPQDGEPGTLHVASAKLDHWAQMGINCVLLRPVNEFAGRHGWGYHPSVLFAIENAYGGPDAHVVR